MICLNRKPKDVMPNINKNGLKRQLKLANEQLEQRDNAQKQL